MNGAQRQLKNNTAELNHSGSILILSYPQCPQYRSSRVLLHSGTIVSSASSLMITFIFLSCIFYCTSLTCSKSQRKYRQEKAPKYYMHSIISYISKSSRREKTKKSTEMKSCRVQLCGFKCNPLQLSLACSVLAG